MAAKNKNDAIGTLKILSKLEIMPDAEIIGPGVVPSQKGHGGKFLATDGKTSFWDSPGGSGDMEKKYYDPNKICSDVFDVDNHISGKINSVFTKEQELKLSKIDETATKNKVNSVFGRTGDIKAENNDYSWSQIDKKFSSLEDIEYRDHELLSNSGQLTHSEIENILGELISHANSVGNAHNLKLIDIVPKIGKNGIISFDGKELIVIDQWEEGQLLGIENGNLKFIYGGNMSSVVYDPDNINEDVYNVDFHKDGRIHKTFTAAERSKLAKIYDGANYSTNIDSISIDINGVNSNSIAQGHQVDYRVPYDCKLLDYVLLANTKGDLKIDIYRSNFESYPPKQENSITGINKVSLKSSNKSKDTELKGWDVELKKDDILRISVMSSSLVINRVNLSFKIEKK